MKQKLIHRNTRVLLLLLLCGCIQSFSFAIAGTDTDNIANTSIRNTPTAQLQQSYTWYDGDIKREVWLNSQLMAEFNPTIAQKNRISAASVEMRIVDDNMGSVRFWRIDPQSTAKSTISLISTRIKSNPVSAVLHDGASTNSGMRALPGNIILYLNPDWDQATAERWLKQKNLQVISQRKLISNVFVIKSKPGLDSLLKANELYESGEVVAAFPNWWKELVGK